MGAEPLERGEDQLGQARVGEGSGGAMRPHRDEDGMIGGGIVEAGEAALLPGVMKGIGLHSGRVQQGRCLGMGRGLEGDVDEDRGVELRQTLPTEWSILWKERVERHGHILYSG